MAVSRLDGRTVKDENEQQQADAALKRGPVILRLFAKHARHCRMC